MSDLQKVIDKKVYGFKTKYPERFTASEIKELLELFPTINMKYFDDAMRGNTCPIIDDQIAYYRWDVLAAVNCGLNK